MSMVSYFRFNEHKQINTVLGKRAIGAGRVYKDDDGRLVVGIGGEVELGRRGEPEMLGERLLPQQCL